MFEPMCELLAPPAIVVEDEAAKYQRLVEQGKEAAALEAEGKHANVAWVQALKAAYPDVVYQGRLVSCAKVYEIIMEVRACSREAAAQFLSRNKNNERHAAHVVGSTGRTSRAYQIRRAAIELTGKYRLGADPAACMEALAKLIEETR
jgi:hypothetical protein